MKVSVIGAGFSGLTLAYYLLKKGFQVEVYEKSSGPGGLIDTKITEYGLVETAATSILNTDKLRKILNDIDIEPVHAKKESKKRYILKNHRPSRFPLSFLGTLHLLIGLFRLIVNKTKWRPKPQESLESWASRLFSNEVSKALISPAMQGIFAESANNLSATLVLRKIFSGQKPPRSNGPVNFNNGMSEFIKGLEKYLSDRGVIFHYNAEIVKDNLPKPAVIATSYIHASHLLDGMPSLPQKNMTTVTLFFNSPPPLEGFGVLFPVEEGLTAHGVLINNCMFEKRTRSGHSETWILSEVNHCNNQQILNKVLNDRIQVFKSDEKPVSSMVTTWPDAFPIYGNELEQKLEQGFDLPDKVFLTGNYLGNLGLSGIIEQNDELSAKIAKELQ